MHNHYIWLGFFAFIYNLAIAFIRNKPDDLKQKEVPVLEHVRSIRGSIIFGNLILFIHFIDLPQMKSILSWIFIAPFIHGNYTHLIVNLSGIGVMSLYEKRVGFKRYLAVFLCSLFISSFSSFFYEFGSIGTSGAVFGLLAAFIIDNKNQSGRVFLSYLALFIFITLVMHFYPEKQYEEALKMQVDHLGHALGGLAAIVYIKLRPLES